jgi:crotonobetainyl-CoA:carnitine CoA-transferase CaiB-like acyl-CoA transferase
VIAGPFVGQILGDLGADVVKLERFPDGDETRSYGDKRDHSAIFTALNRNKRSIAIDLAHAGARPVLTRLVEGADVIVHNFRPGVMERLGLGVDDAWRINPRVVYCAISGFGATGPLVNKPGNDVIAQAFSGLMSYTGDPASPPVRVPVSIGDYVAGLYASVGILAALVERSVSGRGRRVETSLLEGMLALESLQIGDFLTKRRLPPRIASGNMFGQPNQAFATRDGAVVIAALHDDMWRRCARALGHGLAEDPRFLTRQDRLTRRDELAAIIEGITSRMSTAQCVAALEDAQVVCSAIHSIRDAVTHPQVGALGILQGFGDAQAETVGSPLVVEGRRPRPRRRPPKLGQDNDSILEEAGVTREQIEALRAQGVVWSATQE